MRETTNRTIKTDRTAIEQLQTRDSFGKAAKTTAGLRPPAMVNIPRGDPSSLRCGDSCAARVPDEAPIDYWKHSTVIARNRFLYKSLSCWACNFCVGCLHACRFCYIPSVSTRRLKPQLSEYGIYDPDLQWGNYLLVRPWDEKAFLSSLRRAEGLPLKKLNPDGNRAVMMCSTTDAYQVVKHPDPARQKELARALRFAVRRALELILTQSTLNVRILTRSPLCREDFDLFHRFGPRLLLGASIPTLDNKLARVYEPNAPAPSQRLATLRAARNAGLHVYVAVAPTYPECDEADLKATLSAAAELDPVTIFSEPINVRAENAVRIAEHGRSIGVSVDTSVFDTPRAWQNYAITALKTVEKLSRALGVEHKLHLWPDASLGSDAAARRSGDAVEHSRWLMQWWARVSEWPF